MSCCVGWSHTIFLSDDKLVYSIGDNSMGQLGLEKRSFVTIPTLIKALPRIQQISCGFHYTICIDENAALWVFGDGQYGKLGLGHHVKNCFEPQKIDYLPPVKTICCGRDHALLITEENDLWSVGNNASGQLGIGNYENQTTYQKTKFSSISKICAGNSNSIFQNFDGEIYVCGSNADGQIGLDTTEKALNPVLIPNQPPNIVQFTCGYYHTLLVDNIGNVFCSGYNYHYCLGLNTKDVQKTFIKLPNLPPIQSISCSGWSSYAIDFDGNLWNFGDNRNRQLGYKENSYFCVPTKLDTVSNVHQISCGSCSEHFFIKDSLGKVFAMGMNAQGQLGTGQSSNSLALHEKGLEFTEIWGQTTTCVRVKSARK